MAVDEEIEDGFIEEEEMDEDSDELFEDLEDTEGEEDIYDNDLARDNLDDENDII